jgi:hypothetical protein
MLVARQPVRGIHKGAAALLWGEPRFMRRGGNPPAPAFPGGETGKGVQIPCAAGCFLVLFTLKCLIHWLFPGGET